MQAYRLKLDELKKLLQVEPDKCELYLYNVGLLIDYEEEYNFGTKKNEIFRKDLKHGCGSKCGSYVGDEEITYYEPIEPDIAYLLAFESLVSDYRKKYADWKRIPIYGGVDYEFDPKPIINNIEDILKKIVDDLNRCKYEVENGIYYQSFYPERFDLGKTNVTGTRKSM